MNHLYYGDNLPRMLKMKSGSVDLIYLDPPFKSERNYNLLYTDMTGRPAPDQDIAFCDTWQMDAEKHELAKKMPMLMKEYGIPDYYVEFWRLWINALRHTNERLLAYLVYMVQRLMQMRVLLKPTGSIFLHCDPEASHYIKVMMDAVFGHENFRNEIIWKRTTAHSDATRKMGSIHDVLLFYSRGDKFTFHPQYGDYDDEYNQKNFAQRDDDGRRWASGDLTAKGLKGGGYQYAYKGCESLWRVPLETMQRLDTENRLHFTKTGGIRIKRYLDEMKGVIVGDVWTDIPPLASRSKKREGYPTQKPPDLLKRIIAMGSNKGDVVFDPFCGCGTTIYAAKDLKRHWIGIDIAILAVQMVTNCLQEQHGKREGKDFEVTGIPVTPEQAEVLFKEDPFEFERWIVQYLDGIPTKRTGDKGIDGRVYLKNGGHVILSVKGGAIAPAHIMELRGAIEREKEDGAVGGCFVSLREPTKKMREEAATAGLYAYNGREYERIQLLTIKQILGEQRELKSESKYRMGKDQLILPF